MGHLTDCFLRKLIGKHNIRKTNSRAKALTIGAIIILLLLGCTNTSEIEPTVEETNKDLIVLQSGFWQEGSNFHFGATIQNASKTHLVENVSYRVRFYDPDDNEILPKGDSNEIIISQAAGLLNRLLPQETMGIMGTLTLDEPTDIARIAIILDPNPSTRQTETIRSEFENTRTPGDAAIQSPFLYRFLTTNVEYDAESKSAVAQGYTINVSPKTTTDRGTELFETGVEVRALAFDNSGAIIGAGWEYVPMPLGTSWTQVKIPFTWLSAETPTTITLFTQEGNIFHTYCQVEEGEIKFCHADLPTGAHTGD